jgi:hypothetical protein
LNLSESKIQKLRIQSEREGKHSRQQAARASTATNGKNDVTRERPILYPERGFKRINFSLQTICIF